MELQLTVVNPLIWSLFCIFSQQICRACKTGNELFKSSGKSYKNHVEPGNDTLHLNRQAWWLITLVLPGHIWLQDDTQRNQLNSFSTTWSLLHAFCSNHPCPSFSPSTVFCVYSPITNYWTFHIYYSNNTSLCFLFLMLPSVNACGIRWAHIICSTIARRSASSIIHLQFTTLPCGNRSRYTYHQYLNAFEGDLCLTKIC